MVIITFKRVENNEKINERKKFFILGKQSPHLELFPPSVPLCRVTLGDLRLGCVASVKQTPLGKLACGLRKAILQTLI